MRKYFLTGLLILVPLAITAWVLSMVIGTLDQSLMFVRSAGSRKPCSVSTFPASARS